MAKSQQVNCVPQQGVSNPAVTATIRELGCRKCSPSNTKLPQNTSAQNFSSAVRKMGMLFCQTQLLAIKPGFIIMTHNEKTINGIVPLVITTQETIQGADFCT